LYGTASTGGSYLSGCGGAGCGTVFELKHTASGWDQIVLYSFTGGTDGGAPSGSLIFDKAGNLYGTAYEGGELGGSCPGTPGCGVVFELQSVNGHWVEKVLHSFLGGTDSTNPSSDLVFDRDGNLYGARQGGGGSAYCYGLGVEQFSSFHRLEIVGVIRFSMLFLGRGVMEPNHLSLAGSL
jgi:hypothetical protein